MFTNRKSLRLTVALLACIVGIFTDVYLRAETGGCFCATWKGYIVAIVDDPLSFIKVVFVSLASL